MLRKVKDILGFLGIEALMVYFVFGDPYSLDWGNVFFLAKDAIVAFLCLSLLYGLSDIGRKMLYIVVVFCVISIAMNLLCVFDSPTYHYVNESRRVGAVITSMVALYVLLGSNGRTTDHPRRKT